MMKGGGTSVKDLGYGRRKESSMNEAGKGFLRAARTYLSCHFCVGFSLELLSFDR